MSNENSYNVSHEQLMELMGAPSTDVSRLVEVSPIGSIAINQSATQRRCMELDEEMAYKNHRQTLSRLAERGGLNVIEIYLNYHKIDIKDFRSISQQDAIALINMLNDK